MQVSFQIFRQIPPDPPQMQTFQLESEGSATILDCLNRIKWEQDGSLAYRKNCRNTICGSCAMRINGRAALACKQHVEEELQPDQPIVIAPLGNMPVIKDLIVDMQDFWANLHVVDPYVSTQSRQTPPREFLQTPEERSRLEEASNCIMCGACYSDCNAREVNAAFVGPHALAKANRLIQDNRDDQQQGRLAQHNSQAGVWGCTRCLNCNYVCPMGVAPLDQITQIKQQILASETGPIGETSREIRHRKLLVDLVRNGGWVDERRFGIQVVANQGRDVNGFLSILPLGLRMLNRWKFPLQFHPSQGTETVKRLIDNVRAQLGQGSPPPP
jgi:succinate dehydrogenase / fumarate reductase iron-sulfur subunit